MMRENLRAMIVVLMIVVLANCDLASTNLMLLKQDQQYRSAFDQQWHNAMNPIEIYKQYVILDDVNVTYKDADKVCKKRNMAVATIRSVTNNTEVLRQLAAKSRISDNKNFWISGRHYAYSGKTYWKRCGDEFNYENWSEGQPLFVKRNGSLNTHNCVEILSSSEGRKWGLNVCIKKNGVVCETAPSEPPRTFRPMKYIFGSVNVSLEDAIVECRNQNAYLASLESHEERRSLEIFMKDIENPDEATYWIYKGDYNSPCDYYTRHPKCHRVKIRNDIIHRMHLHVTWLGCAHDKAYALCEKLDET